MVIPRLTLARSVPANFLTACLGIASAGCDTGFAPCSSPEADPSFCGVESLPPEGLCGRHEGAACFDVVDESGDAILLESLPKVATAIGYYERFEDWQEPQVFIAFVAPLSTLRLDEVETFDVAAQEVLRPDAFPDNAGGAHPDAWFVCDRGLAFDPAPFEEPPLEETLCEDAFTCPCLPDAPVFALMRLVVVDAPGPGDIAPGDVLPEDALLDWRFRSLAAPMFVSVNESALGATGGAGTESFPDQIAPGSVFLEGMTPVEIVGSASDPRFRPVGARLSQPLVLCQAANVDDCVFFP